MKVDFETSPGGAAGGNVTVQEGSSLGSCSATLHTTAGQSANDIASSIAKVFQSPGIPGPATCPAMQNPRDVTVDGTSLVSVVASELRVCNSDPNVGLVIGPKELPNLRHRVLQYAAKFLCGEAEHREHHERDHDKDKDKHKDKDRDKDKDKDKDDKDRDRDREHREEWEQVVQGRYYTAINLHNPTDRPTAIRFKFAVALPDGKPGPVSPFSEITLGPDEAASIDCARIYELLRAKPEFIDGFAVIESDVELDVVAVYSAGGGEHGRVETLHTERVPARLLQ
jgi:hypothetical protein